MVLENPVQDFIDAQLNFRQGKIDYWARRAIISAFHAQATPAQKTEVSNHFAPLMAAARQRQIEQQAELRKKLAERREREVALAPFNALRQTTKHSPSIDDVRALVDLGVDVEKEVGFRGSPTIGDWEWLDEVYYEGNDEVELKDRNGRVIWEGSIESGYHEFKEGASASMRFPNGPETPVFMLTYSTFQEPKLPEQFLGEGVGSWRYVEEDNGDYAVEPVVVQRKAEEFDSLDALFRRLEEVSVADWSPNDDL